MKVQIVDLVKDSEVEDHFLVGSMSRKLTKHGKPYLIVVLKDKSGDIDSRVWDIPEDLDVRENSIVKVRGKVDEYRDVLQLQISKIRLSTDGEYDLTELIRCSDRPPDDMLSDLWDVLHENVGAGSQLLTLVDDVLTSCGDDLKRCPAAKSIHHCFLGGLLEHVLSLCRAAVPLCAHYQLRIDLVLATCVLHDIGKVRELSYGIGIGYTVEGSMLGHISIGMEMVSQAMAKIPEFPQRLRVELMHMIASHHGLLEWGSPKVPMMREAIAMHMLDLLDSRMETCKEILRKKDGDDTFSAFSKHLNTYLYKDTL